MTAILTQGIAGKTTYTAQWFVLSTGTSAGAAVTMTETYSGTYTANPSGLAANTYILVIKDAAEEVGRTIYRWDGTREIVVAAVETATAYVTAATGTTLLTYTKLPYARYKNKVVISTTTKKETIFDIDGTTILSVRDLKGADGLPNSEQIYEARP